MNCLQFTEKVIYQIRRIRAYGYYFWTVKDVRKDIYLFSGGGTWCSCVTLLNFPSDRFQWKKSDILLRVPGYYISKEKALKKLNEYIQNK